MDLFIIGVKCLTVLLVVLTLSALMLWLERKGSALIQNRLGANRAAVFGVLPFNLGVLNTLLADPIKLFTKEDFVPDGADKFVHTAAPFLALFPAVVTFAAMPFGDTVMIGDRVVELRAVGLDVGILYVSAMVAMGVYGVVLAGWASNNRWALLGSIRGTAQMISYELAMGLALVSVILLYGTLDLQAMVRQQGGLIFGFLPAWGVFYQPLALVIIFVAGMAESKRIPFDIPEAESELIAGYFTEYSGGKQACFMLADFARGGDGRRSGHHVVLRWLAGSLPERAGPDPARVGPGRCAGVTDHPGAGRSLLRQGSLLLLAAVPGAMDGAPLPLRPTHDPGMEAHDAVGAGQCLRHGSGDSPVGDAGVSPGVFYTLATALLAAALGVVLTPNPVRSALWLVAALFVLSIFYVALDAHLVAALQIIVYAGAVMVLFLFVITLLNLQAASGDRAGQALLLVAVPAAAVLGTGLATTLWNAFSQAGDPAVLPEGFGTTAELARHLFSQQLVAFELTSVLLLVAIVGAVVIAGRGPEDAESSAQEDQA